MKSLSPHALLFAHSAVKGISSKVIFSEKSLSVPTSVGQSVCPSICPSFSVKSVASLPKKKSPKQKLSLNKVVRCNSRVTKIHSESH